MIILKNIYYSPQSKNSISLEVGEETKLLPDSVFGLENTSKHQKTPSFFLISHAP